MCLPTVTEVKTLNNFLSHWKFGNFYAPIAFACTTRVLNAHTVVKLKMLKFLNLAQNKQHVYENLPGEHDCRAGRLLLLSLG